MPLSISSSKLWRFPRKKAKPIKWSRLVPRRSAQSNNSNRFVMKRKSLKPIDMPFFYSSKTSNKKLVQAYNQEYRCKMNSKGRKSFCNRPKLKKKTFTRSSNTCIRSYKRKLLRRMTLTTSFNSSMPLWRRIVLMKIPLISSSTRYWAKAKPTSKRWMDNEQFPSQILPLC